VGARLKNEMEKLAQLRPSFQNDDFTIQFVLSREKLTQSFRKFGQSRGRLLCENFYGYSGLFS
jgi:hypothetical protein